MVSAKYVEQIFFAYFSPLAKYICICCLKSPPHEKQLKSQPLPDWCLQMPHPLFLNTPLSEAHVEAEAGSSYWNVSYLCIWEPERCQRWSQNRIKITIRTPPGFWLGSDQASSEHLKNYDTSPFTASWAQVNYRKPHLLTPGLSKRSQDWQGQRSWDEDCYQIYFQSVSSNLDVSIKQDMAWEL